MSAAAVPRRAPKFPSEAEFQRALKGSLIVHVAAFLAILIGAFVFPRKSINYVPTLRVDVVGLPDIAKKDLDRLSKATVTDKAVEEAIQKAEAKAKAEAKKVEEAQPDEMVLHPKSKPNAKDREKRLKGALARIKALSKISEEPEAPAIIKGNKVSKGTSLSGDAREAAEVSYNDTLREWLRERWELPQWLSRQSLSAQVEIFLDGRGRLRNYRFLKVSGNPQFDDAVKRTLIKAQPFPKPPSDLAQMFLIDGIKVGFPL